MKISSAFTTNYASKCSSCGTSILPGAAALYIDDQIIGEACCGDDQSRIERDGAESETSALFGESYDVVTLTMPRGKTVRDRCPTCFQIPSSNGVCGCD